VEAVATGPNQTAMLYLSKYGAWWRAEAWI
jgi:hypothetical protein